MIIYVVYPALQPQNKTQGTYIWKSRSYITTGSQAPGANAEVALTFAEGEVEEAIVEINALFGEPWDNWRKQVEAIESSPFEKIERIE